MTLSTCSIGLSRFRVEISMVKSETSLSWWLALLISDTTTHLNCFSFAAMRRSVFSMAASQVPIILTILSCCSLDGHGIFNAQSFSCVRCAMLVSPTILATPLFAVTYSHIDAHKVRIYRGFRLLVAIYATPSGNKNSLGVHSKSHSDLLRLLRTLIYLPA